MCLKIKGFKICNNFLLNLHFPCTKFNAKCLHVKLNVFVQSNVYYDVTS